MLKYLLILTLLCTQLAHATTGCIATYIRKHNPAVNHGQAVEIELALRRASRPQTRDYDYTISPYLLTGLMIRESTARPHAVSSERAEGLCQVVPKWNQRTWAKMVLLTDTDSFKTIAGGAFACGEALRERLHAAKGSVHGALDRYHGHWRTKGERLAKYRRDYNYRILRYTNEVKQFCEKDYLSERV